MHRLTLCFMWSQNIQVFELTLVNKIILFSTIFINYIIWYFRWLEIAGNAFPLPNIKDILDQLGKSMYYSTLDLVQGHYFKCPWTQTASSTDKDNLKFLRIPFCWIGFPVTFQRFIKKVLSGLNGLKAIVYPDHS